MVKRLLVVVGWSLASLGSLVFSLTLLLGIARQADDGYWLKPQVEGWSESTGGLVFSAIPPVENRVATAVDVADARAEILRQYLLKYDSPLVPYADLLVRVADENGFDFRWMVAIAQQESNLCKRIPPESYNCWGWGIYGDKVTRFASYEEAITRIAPQFREKFLIHGSETDPEKVMQTYTPPSDGSWAFGINQFMEEME